MIGSSPPLISLNSNPSIANFNSYMIEFYNDTLAFLLFETEEKPFPFKDENIENDIIDAEVDEIEDIALNDNSKDFQEDSKY